MYEGLNHWTFVIAAYAIGVAGTAVLVLSSVMAMRRAETRRDRARDQ
jgi:heme exporter protein D